MEALGSREKAYPVPVETRTIGGDGKFCVLNMAELIATTFSTQSNVGISTSGMHSSTFISAASLSITTPAATLEPITASESPWLILRLIDSFSLAVLQQSKESGINGNMNDGTSTFLSYWMSPFAMMCMITAVVMNRVVIFASSRRHRRLPYISNLLLRSFAIYILCLGSFGLFVSLKCYCHNPLIQYLLQADCFTFDREKFMTKTFLSVPFGSNIYEGLNKDTNETEIGPTTSVLKGFHLSLCISQILDTFIAVACGTKPSLETGITLFEYSLAFQEAQFVSKPSVELLTIALIALTNQLNIHLLGLFNLIKYKLIPSSILGLFTLTFYAYNILTGNILKIPFIIILGYFPHFCVLLVIMLSESIFLLSGIIRFSFKDLTMMSLLENWNSVNISLSDDFYTALINFGEFVINISISQCYIQETSNIKLPIDNYINMQLSELKKEETKKLNGYGNEYKNNPELVDLYNSDKNNEMKKTNKRKRSWIFIIRLKMLNKVIFKFLKLIKVKIISFIGKKANKDSDGTSFDEPTTRTKSIIKYRIVPNDKGGFVYASNEFESVDIDNLSMADIESSYPELLMNTDLLESDNSPDYDYEEMEENDEVSENESDIGGISGEDSRIENSVLELRSTAQSEKNDTPDMLNELITLPDLKSLLFPSAAGNAITNQILSYHLQHLNEPVSHLTRSYFAKYYVDDIKLLDLLKEKHRRRMRDDTDCASEKELDVHGEDLGICVICHENSRQIILWPCKCLAICENCRISLFVREFATCVCCRHPVEGYSKVYIP